MEKLKRYIVFLVGLFINSLGVSLITKASLGTSPISSIPYVLSLNFPFTLGNFTIFFSCLLILIQLVILGKNFKAEHALQIPISVLFGYFIDWTMLLFGWFAPTSYIVKIVALLIGCVILGFGVWIEVLANVAMLPGESFVRAVSGKWHFEFGTTKICFDSSLAIIAAILSFIFAHKLDGVREGTIIAALLVGFIAKQFGKIFRNAGTMLFGASAAPANAPVAAGAIPTGSFCITLGRQFGCGGRETGRELAKRLGIPFYDEEIISETAGTTGFTNDFISKQEEAISSNLLYDFANQVYAYSAVDYYSPKQKIYEAETEVIKGLAAKGSCIILGRMADYVLRDNPNMVSVFLHTPLEKRIDIIKDRHHLTADGARELIFKEEKKRSGNYRYYTNQIWGFSGNYDVTLDATLGIDFIEKTIKDVLKQKSGIEL